MQQILCLLSLLWLAAAPSIAISGVIPVPLDQPTIEDALGIASLGDTILVSDADPEDPAVVYDEVLTLVKGVRVLAKSGEAPIIDVGTAATTAVTFPSTADSDTKLVGFTVRGGETIIKLAGDGVVEDCILLSNGDDTDYGISYLDADSPVIRNVDITLDNTGVTSVGIRMVANASGLVGTIEDCSVTILNGDGNDDRGIFLDLTSGSPPEVDISDCLVNVSHGVGIYAKDVSPSSAISNVTVIGGVNAFIGMYLTDGDANADHCMVAANGAGIQADDSTQVEYCVAEAFILNGTGYDDTDPRVPGIGNLAAEALFCDDANDDFTLRVDSYGNPENNASGTKIGAFGVACAYGTLARDTEFSDGTLAFTGDLKIPSGKTLTLSGSNIFDKVIFEARGSDGGNLGSDGSLVELIVESGGELDVSPTSSATVTFTSASASPAEGDWVGSWSRTAPI